jgi:hypothetical protein
VKKIIGISSALMLLAVAPIASSQISATLPAGLEPEMTISVHNYADVPDGLLSAAEGQAKEIFHRSGLETAWLNCAPKLEAVQPKSCYFSDSSHLTLKINAHALQAKSKDRLEVLGYAYPDDKGIGWFAYVFYDRINQLAERERLGHSLLAEVMAHEVGHLLLGSNSHSVAGIMSAHWTSKQLKNIAEGAMNFLPAQSKIMRERVRDVQAGSLAQTPTPQEEKISPAS